jgi:ribonuclease P protein component
VIRSIRQRRDFDYLHRAGTRLRPTVDAEVNRSMWCVYAPPRAADSPELVSIAFAIGRSVGPAVTRNRLRRRVRGLLQMNHSADVASVPAGWYLFGASPGAARLTRRQFADAVSSLLVQAAPRSSVGS